MDSIPAIKPGSLKLAICKYSLFGPISGADETLVTYATHLHRNGYDVTVVLLHAPPPDDAYLHRLRDEGVPIVILAPHPLALRALQRVIRTVRRVGRRRLVISPVVLDADTASGSGRFRALWRAWVRRATLRKQRVCVQFFAARRYSLLHVLTPDVGAEIMIRAGHASRTPVLYHEMGTPHHMPEINGTYERLAEFTSLCTRIAALSPTLARQWEGRLPHASEIMTLPLLVEQPRCWAIPRRDRIIGPIYGFAARMDPGKGAHVLVDAFADLSTRYPRAYLRLAGSGPMAEHLHLYCRALGLADRVEFVGAYQTRDGGSAFMQTLDVFVQPTFAEGTPNSIIEAMACGIPIIASNVGGISDMITADSGILVSPGDAAALAEAMGRFADDPDLGLRMGVVARRRYQTTYSPQAALPVLLATYAEIAR